jgi:suppressor of ftsI
MKVKIPFINPVIVGKFPYHCHILEHEDGGMMGNLRVTAAP